MSKKNQISIFGIGSLGQAMAYLASLNGHHLHIYDPDPSQLKKIRSHPKFNQLPITCYQKPEPDLFVQPVIIPCIPSANLDQFYQLLSQNYQQNKIISVTKGFYPGRRQTISQALPQNIPRKNFIALSGPNMAGEIINHAPTSTIIASQNPRNFTLVKQILQTNFFQIETSRHLEATEISGIYKNCYAISLGIIDQLSHAMNTKARAIIRMVAEIKPLYIKLKAEELATSTAFLGDLIATGLNPASRNYRYGFLRPKKPSQTTEGSDNLKTAISFARQYKINLPILETTRKILENKIKAETIFRNI